MWITLKPALRDDGADLISAAIDTSSLSSRDWIRVPVSRTEDRSLRTKQRWWERLRAAGTLIRSALCLVGRCSSETDI